MKTRFFSYILFILLTSCAHRGNTLSLEVSDVDYINKTELLLKGTQIDINIDGIQDFLFADSFLIVFSSNPDHIISVFDSKNYSLVSEFGKYGRAKNEFSQSFYLLEKANYRKNGRTMIPVVDNGNLIKEIDITNSILQDKVVINDVCEYPIFGWGYGTVGLINNGFDSLFYSTEVGYHPVRKKRIAPKFVIYDVQKQKEKEIKVYPRLMKIKKEEYYKSLYYLRAYKHPNKNIFACPFFCRDYIFYFDIDNDRSFAIHQAGTESFNTKLSDSQLESIQEKYAFTSAEVTDDFIITLYFAGDFSRGFEKDHEHPEILLFDWEGNYLSGAKLDDELHAICFDKNNNILYGVNYSEESIYRYDLGSLIEAIK